MLSPRIGVFWDVDECPMPEGFEPWSFYEAIIGALEKEGYYVSDNYLRIIAYDEKKTLPRSEMLYLPAPVIHITKFGGSDKYERMFTDMTFWGITNATPANVIVVSRNISENKDLVAFLKSFHLRGYGIALADSVLPTSTPSAVWLSREELPGEVEARPIFQSQIRRSSCSPQSSGSSA